MKNILSFEERRKLQLLKETDPEAAETLERVMLLYHSFDCEEEENVHTLQPTQRDS